MLRRAWEALSLEPHEALKHRQRTELSQVAAALEELDGEVREPDVRIAFTRARVAEGLEDWSEAVEHWRAVLAGDGAGGAALDEESRDTARAGLAVALAQLGEVAEAVDLVRRLGPEGAEARAVVRELTEQAAASSLVQTSHRLHALGSREHARATLEVALRLQGVEEHDAARLQVALDGVAEFRAKGGLGRVSVDTDRPEPTAEVPLLIGGLGWSGSGAVVDYLLGVEEVSGRYGRGELACFANGPLSPLTAVRKPSAEVPEAAAASASWALLGVVPPMTREPGYLKRSLAEVLPGSDGLIQRMGLAERFLARISDPAERSAAELEEAVAALFADVVALNPDPKRYLLLNNAFKVRDLEPLRLLPRRRLIAVLRDPRDQFVAQRVESDSALTPKAFCRSLAAAYEGLFSYVENGACRHEVTVVRYEDFVLDGQVRDDLLAGLDLPGPPPPDYDAFSPEKARPNIGLHRHYRPRRHIEMIEERLGHYGTLYDAS